MQRADSAVDLLEHADALRPEDVLALSTALLRHRATGQDLGDLLGLDAVNGQPHSSARSRWAAKRRRELVRQCADGLGLDGYLGARAVHALLVRRYCAEDLPGSAAEQAADALLTLGRQQAVPSISSLVRYLED